MVNCQLYIAKMSVSGPAKPHAEVAPAKAACSFLNSIHENEDKDRIAGFALISRSLMSQAFVLISAVSAC